MPNYKTSVWLPSTPHPRYPALDRDVEVDVAVIGGGVTGVTAARLLENAGRRVALIEARRIGKGETEKTTAHLTEALDTRYHALISKFGVEGASLAAEGQRTAIGTIAKFTERLAIPCDFRRLPGFLYAERADEVDELERECGAARRAGVLAALTDEVPLPFPTVRALCFEDQATFHPRIYLQALAEAFAAAGGTIYEETQVTEIEDGEPCRVITDRGVVTAADVIVATHAPVSTRVLLHTKLAAYRSYAVAVDLPAGFDGLFWDLGDPYHYLRYQLVDGRSYLLAGGEDHKVGEQDDTTAPFRRLEEYVRSHFGRPVAATDFRWSGQVIEPADGLPYVGTNPGSDHVYVATGYSGNGMTQGTLAALMLADQIAGEKTRWDDLLDATRFKPLASAKAFVTENLTFPKQLIKDRLPQAGPEALAGVAAGEGQVLSLDGQRLAVYRNSNGELGAVSAVCTHLGCLVQWNSAGKSWDCPCHGSRFDPHGRVLNGPAVAPLQAQPLAASALGARASSERLPLLQDETWQRAAAEEARALDGEPDEDGDDLLGAPASHGQGDQGR
jgi:glycine/D-amino acid oxidase-like deaminating enzyme/nitrite reductase/ring-hydroxylating ferredoxin subunit